MTILQKKFKIRQKKESNEDEKIKIQVKNEDGVEAQAKNQM